MTLQPYLVGPATERLEHRAMTVDDAEAFYALNSHPDVMRYTGEPPIGSVDECRQAILSYPDFESVGYGRWACVLKETREMIGFCGLKYLPELGETDIGYRFLPEFWGQGLATEACVACVRFGFETIGLKRILGIVLPDNAASIRVLEKIGMKPEGPAQYDGFDVLRFSIDRGAYPN